LAEAGSYLVGDSAPMIRLRDTAMATLVYEVVQFPAKGHEGGQACGPPPGSRYATVSTALQSRSGWSARSNRARSWSSVKARRRRCLGA